MHTFANNGVSTESFPQHSRLLSQQRPLKRILPVGFTFIENEDEVIHRKIELLLAFVNCVFFMQILPAAIACLS